jgi:hypothetical protein
MRYATLAILGLFTVAACETRPGDETGRADAADTVITSEQNVDTTVITQDTSVEVDTIKEEGDEPVSEDTLKKSGSTTNPSADTGHADTAQH